MNNETPISSPEHLLSDINVEFEYASRGQRFLNFLIDYVVIVFGGAFVFGMFLGFTGEESSSNDLTWNLAVIVLFLAYYTFCELLFKGRTLGKLITGTRAVRTDNEPLTFQNAILRSLSRLVPFEAFSGFGTPWHDSWTGTMVIKTR